MLGYSSLGEDALGEEDLIAGSSIAAEATFVWTQSLYADFDWTIAGDSSLPEDQT